MESLRGRLAGLENANARLRMELDHPGWEEGGGVARAGPQPVLGAERNWVEVAVDGLVLCGPGDGPDGGQPCTLLVADFFDCDSVYSRPLFGREPARAGGGGIRAALEVTVGPGLLHHLATDSLRLQVRG